MVCKGTSRGVPFLVPGDERGCANDRGERRARALPGRGAGGARRHRPAHRARLRGRARGLQRIGQVYARAAAVRHAPRGRGPLHRRRHRPRPGRRRPAGGPPGGRPGPPAPQRPDRLHRRGRRGRLRSPQPRPRIGRGRAPRGGRPRRGGARRLHRPRHGGALRRRAAAARARRRPGDGTLLPRARRGVLHAGLDRPPGVPRPRALARREARRRRDPGDPRPGGGPRLGSRGGARCRTRRLRRRAGRAAVRAVRAVGPHGGPQPPRRGPEVRPRARMRPVGVLRPGTRRGAPHRVLRARRGGARGGRARAPAAGRGCPGRGGAR